MTTDPYLQAEIDALSIWTVSVIDETCQTVEASILAAERLAETARNIGEHGVYAKIAAKAASVRTFLENENRPIDIDHDDVAYREHRRRRAGLNF